MPATGIRAYFASATHLTAPDPMPPSKKPASKAVKIHSTAIEMVALADLKAYEKNARQHPEDQLAALEAIIRDSGFTAPLIIDPENGIIAGHGRALVAKRLKMAAVPCIRVTGLSPAQIKALRLSDNQAALRGTWDQTLLLGELTGLGAEGFDLGLTAFSPFELGQIKVPGFLPEEQIERAEETPPPPAKPCVRMGEVWLLGDHRLVIGDSTDAKTVEKLHGDDRAALCFTSPPYGQQRDYGAAKELVRDWDRLMRGVFGNLRMSDDGQILVNLGMIHRDGEWLPYWDAWIAWMRTNGWRSFGWYVWDKLAGQQGDWQGRLAPAHEFIFHFNRSTKRPNKTKQKKAENIKLGSGTGLRRADGSMSGISSRAASMQTHKIPDSVFRITPHKSAGKHNDHPAMFPVALASEAISAYGKPGDVVFEPFAGSGTTLIACEMEGRRCFAIELDLAYAEVIIRRWEGFTKGIATREDGKTLADLTKPKARAKAKETA